MEILVERVTSAFREQMWRTMRLPHAAALRRARAERIWLRLLQRGFSVVARDPELHLYLALTAEVQSPKRDLFGFLRERALRRLGWPTLAQEPLSARSATERAAQAEVIARLAGLPPRARMVLVARRREHLSYQDIGKRLGCSAEKARSLFALALRAYTLSGKSRF